MTDMHWYIVHIPCSTSHQVCYRESRQVRDERSTKSGVIRAETTLDIFTNQN